MAETREHEPGDHHDYRLECTVCGQFGQVQVSVEPQRAGPPEGWRWECASCHRPVTPMGMCETCGVFGIMCVAESKP